MALAVPLSRFTPRVGGGSAFFVRLLMRIVILPVIGCLLAGCATSSETRMTVSPPVAASDPIDQLVDELSQYNFWQNGVVPDITLPKTASTAQLVEALFKWRQGLDGTEYRILKERHVCIDTYKPETFTAVLIETNRGKKIMLFQYMRHPPNSDSWIWWGRVYDAKPAA